MNSGTSPHPHVGNLSEKSMEDLSEAINTLGNRMSWAFKMGKHDMVKQMQQLLASYRAEYSQRQQELWNKNRGTSQEKIDIS
jgi:hypothetical protein